MKRLSLVLLNFFMIYIIIAVIPIIYIDCLFIYKINVKIVKEIISFGTIIICVSIWYECFK